MKTALVVAFCVVLSVMGCGSDGSGSTGGTPGTGGTAGSGASGGSAGVGASNGSNDPDCVRICESPCVGEVLPIEGVDDCIRACEMGGVVFDDCREETIAVLTCIEGLDCGGGVACLEESAAFTACITP